LIKILLVNDCPIKDSKAVINAVSYHRLIKPNQVLKRFYNDYEFSHCTMNDAGLDEDYFKQFQLVIFSRSLNHRYTDILDKLGIKYGIDVDDYWELPTNHIAYEDYKQNSYSEILMGSIRKAHFVITTTEILANKIKVFNKEVYIIENGIDTTEHCWQPHKTKSKFIRYGFTGGNTHYYDMLRIHKDVQKAFYDDKLAGKIQMVLCGFNAKFNEQSIYIGYENMLTDRHKTFKKYHPNYSNELRILETPEGLDKPYRRINSIDVFNFAYCYDNIDICIAPLEFNEFNRCKSELKMIEAGFKNCGAMVYHDAPYAVLATDKNSYDLNKRTFFEWARYINQNPNSLADTKAQLKIDTQKYNLEVLSKKRVELYKKYIN
jgi:hypothetical protein